MSTLDKLRSILEGEIGYRESGVNHQKYSPAVPGLEWSQNQPWCATFNAWAYLKAGLRPNVDFPVTASCLAGVDWYKSRGRWHTSPKVGDQVFYGPNGGTHVEIVVGVSSHSITTIGGNTSGSLGGAYYNGDGVYKKSVDRNNSRIYGYGRPNFPSTPSKEDGAPNMDISLGSKNWIGRPRKGQALFMCYDVEYADPEKQHGDGKAYPTILMTYADYVATAAVTVENLPKDGSCWIRFVEVEKQNDGSFKVVETGPTRTIRGTGSTVYESLTNTGTVNKNRRLRVQMGGFTHDGVKVKPTSVKIHAWKK